MEDKQKPYRMMKKEAYFENEVKTLYFMQYKRKKFPFGKWEEWTNWEWTDADFGGLDFTIYKENATELLEQFKQWWFNNSPVVVEEIPIIEPEIYYFKRKPYKIFCNSKLKFEDEWKDVVIYEALYNNPDGKYWVRFKDQFFELFKTQIDEA